MYFKQYYLGCLSHASYLIGSDGEAVVVDPQRDVEQYLSDAEANGLKIKHIIETHLHADFVSGHRELAERTNARIYMGQRAAAAFDYVPVADGDEIQVGQVVLRFMETPGHTPEGISVVVYKPGISPEPRKVLTGDTLFIGDVGRPDLVAAKGYTEEDMARMLYDSLRSKLLTLPDTVEIYPAHGAGSACGRFISDERSSTLGDQRRTNWALQDMDREEFVQHLTTGLTPPPGYFTYDAEMNRRGAVSLDALGQPANLRPNEVVEAQEAGGVVLDVRSAAEYAAGHVPGSLNIGLSGMFASWAGGLISMGTPIVLVAGDDEQVNEAAVRLARVGHETVTGYLEGGMQTWLDDGLPVATLGEVSVEELHRRYADGDPQVLDVREPSEHERGHAPGARHVPLGQLDNRVDEVDSARPVYVICGSGYRSPAACAILRKHGFTNVVNVRGGHGAWERAGLPLSQPSAV